jgi:hypothetical protein
MINQILERERERDPTSGALLLQLILQAQLYRFFLSFIGPPLTYYSSLISLSLSLKRDSSQSQGRKEDPHALPDYQCCVSREIKRGYLQSTKTFFEEIHKVFHIFIYFLVLVFCFLWYWCDLKERKIGR